LQRLTRSAASRTTPWSVRTSSTPHTISRDRLPWRPALGCGRADTTRTLPPFVSLHPSLLEHGVRRDRAASRFLRRAGSSARAHAMGMDAAPGRNGGPPPSTGTGRVATMVAMSSRPLSKGARPCVRGFHC
jgi:hypothetical protein